MVQQVHWLESDLLRVYNATRERWERACRWGARTAAHPQATSTTSVSGRSTRTAGTTAKEVELLAIRMKISIVQKGVSVGWEDLEELGHLFEVQVLQ